MTGKEIRALFEAAPFAPFDILLANGDTVHVPHPDMMNLSNHDLVVTVHRAESFRQIDVLHVVALEVPITPDFDFSKA